MSRRRQSLYVTEKTKILGADTTWIRRIPHYGSVPNIGEKLPDISIPTVKGSIVDYAIPKRYRQVEKKPKKKMRIF